VALTDQERDLQCMRRIQSGDSVALAELYDHYTPLLYPVALRILRSATDAEDAVQDAWVQVWKRAAAYDARRGNVAAWLLTVVRTRALDRYRSLASRSRAESAAETETSIAQPVDPARDVLQIDTSERVRAALARLEPRQRRVLEIAYFEGLSQSEIAEKLDAPLGTVKSWTRQGLMRLRELLPQQEWV
jgi:RNA polymerase sigma-70 factor, ECF subfamily